MECVELLSFLVLVCHRHFGLSDRYHYNLVSGLTYALDNATSNTNGFQYTPEQV